MEWMLWVLLALALVAFAWMVGLVLKFNRLQSEHKERDENDRRALRSLLVKLYKEAIARGDDATARGVQLQGYTMGVDVAKEAAWSRAS